MNPLKLFKRKKTKYCPHCQKEISKNAMRCRWCGKWLVTSNNQKNTLPLLKWKRFLNLSAFFIVLIFLASFDVSKETLSITNIGFQNDKDSIKYKISSVSFQQNPTDQKFSSDSLSYFTNTYKQRNHTRSKPHCLWGKKE